MIRREANKCHSGFPFVEGLESVFLSFSLEIYLKFSEQKLYSNKVTRIICSVRSQCREILEAASNILEESSCLIYSCFV
jgi:hypothetical protein